MAKPVVFISHITQEAKLAAIIKEHIEETFIGQIDVFVSSDGKSIQPGTRWLNAISENLRVAEMMFVLCSQASINRPWINFEAGAAWVKEIYSVPICHTDLRPGHLPVPLSSLQGISAENENNWREVYEILIGKISAKRVNPDYPKLIAAIKAFEEEYRATLQAAEETRPAQAAPSRGSPAELAMSAIQDEKRSRERDVQRYMEWLVGQLDNLNPDYTVKEPAPKIFLDALDRTIPLVAEFALTCQLVAQLEDEKAAEAIYSGFEQLLNRYEGSAAKPHPDFHINGQYIDYDFYRFLGHELLVTFVSFLVKEQRWSLLDEVLSRNFYIASGANRRPRAEQFEYASQWVTLLTKVAKTFDQDFYSPHGHLLMQRHNESDLVHLVPAQQFMDADLLLFLRSNNPHTNTSNWEPKSTLYLKQLPRYLVEAESKRGAERLLKPLELADLAELRDRLNRRIQEHPRVYQAATVHTALADLEPIRIGFK